MMKQSIKTWVTGGISAMIAYGSTLLPAGSTACVGTACGACPVGCFSGMGVIWLIILYLRKTAVVSFCPAMREKLQAVRGRPAKFGVTFWQNSQSS